MNRLKQLQRSSLALCCTLLFACESTDLNAAPTSKAHTSETQATSLTVTTWNTEHLAYPLTDGCRPRSSEELARLKAYVESLDSDIVGLQEVASVEAVQQLFPKKDWTVYLSERPDNEPYTCRDSGANSTQQKVAFAVRNNQKVVGSKSLSEFALDRRGLRYGLELTIDTPSGNMTLLNVHMKSGCFVDDYTRSDTDACQTLAKQVVFLDQWVEQKESQKTPYMILGDFNHRLSAPYNKLTRTLSNNSDNSASNLYNTTEDLIGCHPYYPAPIDHIFVGNMPESGLEFNAKTHHYENMEPDAMLSDHCATSVEIAQQQFSLDNSVKWQTQSAEYRFLTTSVYNRATEALKKVEPANNWVVVMDVDETVLDNSAYQVGLNLTGKGYSPATWEQWVVSEKAVLVPGVKQFIDAVLSKGGKLGLVTNRGRHLDKHTWANLKALGIPVSTENTCLLGRVDEDKSAIDGASIKNDKDLRRQQISNGTASCFHPTKGRHTDFPKQSIVMQVGDNIEDFSGVLQEHADVNNLVEQKYQLFLLPNPMYGSW
ncbi:endonuclease/exonuclease/phosphatase [Alteromonadaceae bacterium M269]|nr:endonuclease/exonuclease/phosphatase [Alteromonadaceae bacterium M269]